MSTSGHLIGTATTATAATGDETKEKVQKITYPFDKYEIEILITDTNKFVGVCGIKMKADFLTHAQKISTSGSHDVEKYYREEED